MELMFAEVLLKAALLCGILRLVARHEADLSFSKISMVVAGIVFLDMLLHALLEPHIGKLTFAAVFIMVVAMIQTFCWVSWSRAFLSTTIFLFFNVLIFLGVQHLASKVNSAVETPMEAQTRRFIEIQSELFGPIETNGAATAAAAPDVSVADALPSPPSEHPKAEPANPAPSAQATQPAPRPETRDEPSAEWLEARRQIKAQGFISDGRGGFVVRINGREYQKGDRLTTTHNGQTYRWRVQAVTRKDMVLDPLL